MFSIDTSRTNRSISKNKSFTLNTTRSTSVLNGKPIVRLYDLPRIPSYYKIDRPSFSKERKKDIQEKLQLNKTVQISTAKRIKNRNLFINSQKNPLLIKTEKDLPGTIYEEKQNSKAIIHELPDHFYQKKREKSYKNIIEGINDIRTTNILVKPSQKKLDHIKPEQLSRQLQVSVKKQTFISKKNQNKQIQPEKYIESQLTLDDIVSIKEDNYYTKNQKPINIFSLLHGEPDVLDSKILENFFFSFTSIIQKTEKVRCHSYRDLSQKARADIKKKKFPKEEIHLIDTQNVPLNFNKIRFEDLLGVATGRCTPETLQAFMSMDNSKLILHNLNQQNIYLKQNFKQKMSNCILSNEGNSEVKFFLKLNVSEDEKKYAQICNKHKQNILQNMNMRKKISKEKVLDKNLHQQLTNKMKDDILHCLIQDTKRNANNRNFKQLTKNLSTSKAMTIKARELISTLKIIKEEEQNLKFVNSKGKFNQKM